MSKLNILLYHGVISDQLKLGGRNSSGKHIRKNQFAKQMQYISKNFNLVSMIDLEKHILKKKIIEKDSVAVTFDDGFDNNYNIAWDVLENYKVPATFYISTGFISKRKKIWTDILEIIFLNNKNKAIRFISNGKIKKTNLGNKLDRISKLNILKKKLKKKRNDCLKEFIKNIKMLNIYEGNFYPELYNFMTWEKIIEMNKSNLIDFGAHTVNHISLTKVDYQNAKYEINKSLKTLYETIRQDVKLFSYPEGQASDFDNKIIDFLRGKINHCPSAIKGINDLNKLSPFKLKRTMVGFNEEKFPL